ncbi:MAG: tellurite resistance TerB family protein [Planctomycetota bacterium]
MSGFLIPVSIILAVSLAVIFSRLIIRPSLAEPGNHPRLGCLDYRSKLVQLAPQFRLKTLVSQLKLSSLFDRAKQRILGEEEHDRNPESFARLDMSILNCRVRLIRVKEGESFFDAFSMEICGSIHAPDDMCRTALKISILDITDGPSMAQAVQVRAKHRASAAASDGSVFCHTAELGKLPHRVTVLSDWTAAAQLRPDLTVLPRKGWRDLQFDLSISSADTDQELAHARCTFAYENPEIGYVDLQENIDRTKVLAVALGFVVSAADNKLYDCEIELIKNWARDNILDDSEQSSEQARSKLDKALEKTIDFFRAGKTLNASEICTEIVEIAPLAQRYDILDLCLYVVQASGYVSAEELEALKNLANWLEVDGEKFRVMMEKVLPVEMHEVRDIETILGISSDMSREKTRQHLNREYSKWNSRVTNADPEVQSQADQMLKLIAEARSQYVAEKPPLAKTPQ